MEADFLSLTRTMVSDCGVVESVVAGTSRTRWVEQLRSRLSVKTLVNSYLPEFSSISKQRCECCSVET